GRAVAAPGAAAADAVRPRGADRRVGPARILGRAGAGEPRGADAGRREGPGPRPAPARLVVPLVRRPVRGTGGVTTASCDPGFAKPHPGLYSGRPPGSNPGSEPGGRL